MLMVETAPGPSPKPGPRSAVDELFGDQDCGPTAAQVPAAPRTRPALLDGDAVYLRDVPGPDALSDDQLAHRCNDVRSDTRARGGRAARSPGERRVTPERKKC